MLQINDYLKCKRVERMFSIPLIQKSYNLAEHQWNVAVLFKHFASIEDVPFDMNVFDLVLKHDIFETVTTDLPWPIKNHNSNVKKLWVEIEAEILNDNLRFQRYTDDSMKSIMNTRQHDLFKVCDTLDLFLFCVNEIKLGNRTKEIQEVISNCDIIFMSIQSKFPKVSLFINKVKEELV